MGHPTLTVKLDDGTGTFGYTVPAPKVLMVEGGGLSLSRGRADEQATVTAGQLSLTFDNSTGWCTLGATSIGFAIKVDTRIRVIETVNGISFNRHTGYVKSWPVSWPAVVDSFATVTISASDAQARGERHIMGVSLAEAILATPPDGYWPLNDAVGSAVAIDRSGQGHSLVQGGSGTGVVFGSTTPPGSESSTAATFANGRYLSGDAITSLPAPGYVVAFATSSAPVGIVGIAFGDCDLQLTDTGVLLLGADVVSAAPLNDGLPHVVAIRFTSASVATVYVDGVQTATGINVDAGPAVYLGATTTGNYGATNFVGTLAHFAMWSTSPSAARMLAISSALLSESGSARIVRLAGYANIPVGTIDAGLTTVPVQDTLDSAAWPAIQDATDAEVGLTYVDGSGNLRFVNRNALPAKTTPDAIFNRDLVVPGAQPTGDDQSLLNYLGVTAQGTGVEQIIRNTTSETAHGRYSDSKTYLVQTDQEALDRGNWLVANHAEPTVRFGQLTLNLFKMSPADQAKALAIEAGTWLRITTMPSQTPGGATADLAVEGLSEQLGENVWTLTLNVVSRSLYAAWILGNSTYGVLDSTTKLYV